MRLTLLCLDYRIHSLVTAHSDNSLTVSIVSYRSAVAELLAMLESLATALSVLRDSHAEAELAIVLIDNSEDNRLRQEEFLSLQKVLQAIACEFRLLQGHGNIGYGAAHNLVISSCKTSHLLLMNPDIVLHKDSLITGLRFLDENPGVTAVSPYAEFEDGRKQYLCKRFPSVLDFFLRGFFPRLLREPFDERLARFEMRELAEDQPTQGIPIISGCFMLCRTSALQAVQGFDEDYFLYFEDFDLSLRLSKQSNLAYLPTMKIVHHGGYSSRKGLKHIRLFIASGRQFFSSHGWRWV